MTQTDEPAFPLALGDGYSHDGMTLRDWFAATIPIEGMKFNTFEEAEKFLGEELPDLSDALATMAFGMRLEAKIRYQYADAMLKARATQEGE